MSSDNKNLILAVVACLAILLGYNYFVDTPKPAAADQKTEAHMKAEGAVGSTDGSPVSLDGDEKVEITTSRADVLKSSTRIRVETPSLKGSISATGARIDDMALTKYHEGLSDESPLVTLLSPAGTKDPYYADFGWVSRDKALKMPTATTSWHHDDKVLTPDTPVILTWDNGQGILFERTIEVDEHYVFTIRDRVKNTRSTAVTLHNYGLIARAGDPPVSEFFILYEGPIGYVDGKLREHKYADLLEEKKISYETTSGWVGMTDKYWLTALIPDQQTVVKANYTGRTQNTLRKYQADFVGPALTIEAGQDIQNTSHFFVGAKSLELLDAYSKTLDVPGLDRAVDFGWFYFITKPLFYTITYFYELLGNFGLAILLLTVLIRGLFFPLSNKSYKSMARMRKFQPELAKLKERYGDDKVKFQQETMAFYKKQKLNPVSGCLPILIQMPVFFALYKVLFVCLEMRHAPFYLWIENLSAPDPTNLFNLFGLIPWAPPSFLHIGVLPILMGGSMFMQQRLNPQPMDSTQQKIFLIMPFFFTYLLASFPAGLVLYWTWSNVLAMSQQMWIIKRNNKEDAPKAKATKKITKKKK